MGALDGTNRRQFILVTLALAPAVGGCRSAGSTARARDAAAAMLRPRFFTVPERAFLDAACDRLIPSDENGPGAVALGVTDFIDSEMQNGFGSAARWYMHGPFVESAPEFGHQSPLSPRDIYRRGIAQVDAHCQFIFGGRTFAQLSDAEKDVALTELENGKPRLTGVTAQEFFELLLQNAKEGYLADPMYGGNKNMASWKMIGFTGARADFADWVGRPGEHYPHGPVGVGGARG